MYLELRLYRKILVSPVIRKREEPLVLAARQANEEEDLILHANCLRLVRECFLILFWNVSFRTWKHGYHFSNAR